MHEVTVRVASEIWRQEALETVPEVSQKTAMWEAVMHDLYELDSAALYHLIQNILAIEDTSLAVLVRIEAADVVDRTLLERAE